MADGSTPGAPAGSGSSAAALVDRFPKDKSSWDKAEGAAALAEAILALGTGAVAEVAAMAAGEKPLTPALFALHNLALHVGRGGAQAQRKVFAEGVTRQLAAAHPPEAKAMLIQELQLALAADATPALAGFLADEALCDPAARALTAFGTSEAKAAVRRALPGAKGTCRISLILAAGELRDAEAAPEILKSADDADRAVRLTALWALANGGEKAAAAGLAKAMKAEGPYGSSLAADAYLLLARRLLESGRKAEAAAIYKSLDAAGAPAHVRRAAARDLTAAEGK
jgi:HEAT repeat protein